MYFPLEKGLYEVAPGLRPFGSDLGAGRLDQCVFQFDEHADAYLANKHEGRAERLSKYVRSHELNPALERAVCDWMEGRLKQEWPERFRPGFRPRVEGFSSEFDAWCSLVQEDVAIVQKTPESNFLAAISLFSANHWGAEEKIGRDFIAIHRPVAGIEKINATSKQLIDAMISKGPYVRFAWGIATDTRLNHHPETPHGIEPAVWAGRSFDPSESARPKLRFPEVLPESPAPLFLRVERQVLWGFPEHDAFVFTIRTYFLDGREIQASPTRNAALQSAIESMTPESLTYKGLTQTKAPILAWLQR
jgi:hypothetical protein